MRRHALIPLLLALLSFAGQAAYYDTLPQGVRTLAYRQVFVDGAQGSFDNSGDYESYGFKVNFNAELLKDINQATKYYFGELQKISPEAYNEFSFGEYQSDIEAKGDVKALGFGYGLSSHLTVYGYVPVYAMKVQLAFTRTQGNNHQAVLNRLQNAKGGGLSSGLIEGITESLPDGSGETLQSILVNYFKYQPLGTWEGRGLGDSELGLMYRLTDWDKAGLLLSAGTVAPTGRKDNPDLLQDVAFGEGHWSLFAEFGGGWKASDELTLDTWTRYTYKFAFSDEIRLPENSDFTLTNRKASTRIRPGDKFDLNTRVSYALTSYLSFSATYIFESVFSSRYESPYADANKILEEKSSSLGHSLRLGASLSSIDAFLSKKFFAPLSSEIAWQKLISGKNRDQYDRVDLEIRMMF